MVFNKKKFNFLVILTVLLIAVIVGFSAISVIAVEKDSVSQVEGEDEELEEPTEEEISGEEGEEENSGEDNNSSTEGGESAGEEKVEESEFVKIQFDNSRKALSYALGLLKKNNYSMTINQSVDAGAAGVSGTQIVSREIYCVDGVLYVKAEADGSDVPMNQGETYVEYAKIEGSNITTKRVGESLTTQSTNSYKQKYGILPSDIPYEIDLKSLSSLKNSPQSKYYEIDETLTAGEFSKYKKNITVTGGSAPREMSITLKIKINKTYGYLESITATETYKIERAGFEASATSNISIKFKYSGMKTSAIEEIKSQLN